MQISDYKGHDLVFIVGAPRGGTSWLQALLGAHPEIVTGQESHLFSNYLFPLWQAWRHSLEFEMNPEHRHLGLPSYLTQEEFDELMLHFIRTVFAKLEGLKPEARFILEKTPAHTLYLDFISYYLPTARYIHIIRDGRDVAVSLMASSKTFGREWAPASIRGAAKIWKTYVLAGCKGRAFAERYIEVRYERLLSNGIEEIRRLFDFLDVRYSSEQVAQIYEAQRFDCLAKAGRESDAIVRSGEVLRQAGSQLEEPQGFYRKGIAGDWRHSLTWLDCQVFYQEAGDLLVELGYETLETIQKGAWFRPLYGSYLVADMLRLKVRDVLCHLFQYPKRHLMENVVD